MFSGKMLADKSIATFSLYFDIYQGEYWQKMLDFIGITKEQLPELVEPFTTAGTLLKDLSIELGINENVLVNVGTLDHFAGMIGTGNLEPGIISLSTGTVMGISTISPVKYPLGIAMHYGYKKGQLIILPVIESGGICLDWFLRDILNQDYDKLDERLKIRNLEENLIF